MLVGLQSTKAFTRTHSKGSAWPGVEPQRHLLTTGWSAFVNKKKLVSGDAVLFLRDMNPSVQETLDAPIHDSHTMFIIGARMEN
ncbi:hypothetical protein Pyn_24254 [Prunus yedoensis var. nudiflora]|uniref:TF-B3 domain-containing protein n=1 Tax=Prunus yedoensis var. nudiflora TaxID=2094558 RepID=A0A314YHI0_PRUYE|nr:hypothetical protein Pyn_24254 [Prunus yedoensis var. nudiflora]